MSTTDTWRMFERSRDLVVVVDAAGRIVYRNPAARKRTGDVATWRECFGTDDAGAAESALREVVGGSEGTTFQWSIEERPGQRAWFLAEVSPADDGVLCISRDITALKRTEQRLRQSEQMMVDTQGVAHLGTWEWDVSLPNATWSAGLYRIYGLTPETYTPSYEQYLKMVHDDDRQRVIDATNRVFHEHVPYSHDERIFRPDGSMRYLHTWAFPVLDEAGKLTHLIGVCQDITDRALADEALHRANAELEQRVADRTRELENALAELEAFNSMVTHDLRAPLAVLQMVVDLMERDPSNTEGRMPTYLERARRAIGNMSMLIDDLLAFARVGEQSLEPTEIDVSGLSAELVADLRATAPEREAKITIEPGLRCTADPALFRIALANVIGNAWKYTQKRPVAEIQVGLAEQDGRRLLFVRDNGVGFDMAEYPRLFAPFHRLKSAVGIPGTGIGLATVQRILQRHGSSITATSQPDAGATFFLSLPGSPAT